MTRTSLRLALIGDSLAYGSGAAGPRDALGPRLAAALTDAGYDVELSVLAVPGAVSRDLAGQVRRAAPVAVDLPGRARRGLLRVRAGRRPSDTRTGRPTRWRRRNR